MIAVRALPVVVLALVAAACQRTPPPPAGTAPMSTQPDASAALDAGAPPASSVSPGSPLARLVPRPAAGPRVGCPLGIVPGVSLGPIALGETLEDLKRAGLVTSNVSDTHADVAVPGRADPGTTLKVSLCQGKIIEIWMDDLRVAAACVTYQGKPVANALPREEIEKLVGPCTAMPVRIGGAFERCGGGLYVGHGAGSFLQLRVSPPDFPFDNACAIASDDGASITLSPKERSSILRQTLNLSELSKYWHVDRPGRDPLRLVKSPFFPEEPLTMFGSPVVWIDEADAKKGTAFLTISKVVATKTKTTVSFAYPIEGVAGSAVFAHAAAGEEWRLETATVAER
jgi:hypothetical protein